MHIRKKDSPYFISRNVNQKDYLAEYNRLLKTLIYFNEFDWKKVKSPEIATSFSS